MTTAKVADYSAASPCHCPVCAGRPGIPPETGQPWRRWHEVQGQEMQYLPPAPEPVEAPRAILAPPPVAKPRRKPPEPPTGTLKERIERIQARTDIGEGMKRMQIGNLLRRGIA